MTRILLPHLMGETGVDRVVNRLRLEGWGAVPFNTPSERRRSLSDFICSSIKAMGIVILD